MFWSLYFAVLLASRQAQSLLQPAFLPRISCKTSPATYPRYARIGGSDFEPQQDGENDDYASQLAQAANDDYATQLAQAEAAIAAAKEARQKLLRSGRREEQQPPVNSRAIISRSDAGTLEVELPPTGVNTNVVLNGAFSVAWFSAIVPATLASGGASLLFMLPFWMAGGAVAKTAVVDPFIVSNLSIGKYAWSVESTYAGQTIKKREGPTEQLRGANVEVAAVVNGVPQFELRLYSSKDMTGLGLGLSEEELEYLAAEINEHLSTVQDPPDKDALF